MTISAINEQLLRAIGVGIAIVGEEAFDFRFHNEKFAEWFGEPAAEGDRAARGLSGYRY